MRIGHSVLRWFATVVIFCGGSPLLPARPAAAGELEGGIGGCKLSSLFLGCKWKPSDCTKPNPPNTLVFSRNDFNLAVDDFNDYLRQVSYYKQCLVDEAKQDVSKRFPDLVIKSVEDETNEIDNEVQSARSQIELQRPLR